MNIIKNFLADYKMTIDTGDLLAVNRYTEMLSQKIEKNLTEAAKYFKMVSNLMAQKNQKH